MAQRNLSSKETVDAVTHAGAKAYTVSPYLTLRRSVLSCMLWEGEFYEDGESIGKRIQTLAKAVTPTQLAELAVEARSVGNLRHVPLLLAAELARRGSDEKHFDAPRRLIGDTIANTIQRADEICEFLALLSNGDTGNLKKYITHQVKQGLGRAFNRFDEYQFAKYNRKRDITLQHALRLTRPKPKSAEQQAIFDKIRAGTGLQTPDTWETNLSAGADKRDTFERLLSDGKLGYMALLRNLRNMEQAGVNRDLIVEALAARKGAHRVLPFRWIAAAKAAPKFEAEIDAAMLATLQQAPKLMGKTIVVIDVSGSMYGSRVSAKSDLDRAWAAAALGAIMREVCDDPVIYATAGNDGTRKHQTELVPNRRGMALADAVYHMCRPLGGGGIFLNQVCNFLHDKEKDAVRTIVFTDEQDCGIGHNDAPTKAQPLGQGYVINVASYNNGIGYGKWTHVDGFSEAVITWIREVENLTMQ